MAIAGGDSRSGAAHRLGISAAVAKSELKIVFAACDAAGAADLARIVAQVEVLTGLSHACDVDLALVRDGQAEPLRLLPRRGRPGRIAFADHGPPGGVPLLLFHTTTGGRSHSPALLAALANAGWRVIAPERPGYGLSDMVAGHAWEQAALDCIDILDALGLQRAAILARGGAQPAVWTGHRLADRLMAGVLLGPDPPPRLDSARTTFLGRSKALFYGSERALRAYALLLSRRTSSTAIARMMAATVRGCAVDEAVWAIPQERAALVRGGRQSAHGMHGFVAEHLLLAADTSLPVLAGAPWAILSGGQDRLFRADDAQSYWQTHLPGSRHMLLPQAGRWLHASHPEAIVQTLASLVDGAIRP